MSKHAPAFHPLSYAVWYDYISGGSPGLKSDVDLLTKGDKRLTEEQVQGLYQKYISECDEATADRVHADLQRLLIGVTESATHTNEEAAHFGSSLAQCSEHLKSGADAASFQHIVQNVLDDTQRMQGAIDVLAARLDESTKEAEQLRNELHRARAEAITDPLTGLVNRKGFDRALDSAIDAAASMPAGVGLLMIDIDHFKRVNDTYGHVFGDKVIKTVAHFIKESAKGRDTVARYGGEEFALLLPDTPLNGAQVLAEQIRTTIAKNRIRRMDTQDVVDGITISIGVASYGSGESPSQFISRADAALYRSKGRGRNCVSLADPPAVATG
jgi:diguanylate cyclase